MEPKTATKAWDWLGTEITPGSRVIWRNDGIGVVKEVYRRDFGKGPLLDIEWERKRWRNVDRKIGVGVSPYHVTALPLPENFADVADDD